ncbi:MAG: hypothetical protein ACJAQ6_000123 [Arenicella sp.]|jgi:hypothetical protein
MISLEQEFAWSRTAISAQGLFGIVLLVIGSPLIGRVVDKLGCARLLFFR